MKKLNDKKGISLIVLVITIIVMIVLASAIILSLSSSGVIGRANKAKTDTNIANAKQVVALAKAEWQLDAVKIKNSDSNIQNFADYAASKLEEAGYKVGVDKDITVSEEGAVNTVYVGEDGERAIIPDGFTVSTVSTEDSVTEGLVVKDEYGNEFVWVPVDGINVKVELNSNYTGNTTVGQETSLVEKYSLIDRAKLGNITEEEYKKEYDDMIESVSTYGGFYVGRYETSWTGTRVASVSNVQPMHSNTPVEDVEFDLAGDDGKGADWHTYYNKQKELYLGSSSVVSGMIYGSQWDAIMDWMKDVPNLDDSSKKYIYDSTGMGHYSYDAEGNVIAEEKLINTGSNPRYSVKNIFDLAGNCYEFTREIAPDGGVVIRGGSYMIQGQSNFAASFRSVQLNPAMAFMDFNTSRLQVYVKL